MSEPKARDIVDTLRRRERLGERLLQRVGRRAWERPDVAVSARIFRLYRLGDPWDPTAGPEDPIPLGPVALRLGEGRRAPAPHALPREAPKAPAGERRLPDGPRPPPAPATARAQARPPVDARQDLAREFGAPDRPKLVGRLPMRPEVAERLAAAEGQGAEVGPTPKRVTPPSPRPPLPRPAGGSRGSARFALKRSGPADGAATHGPEVVMRDEPPPPAVVDAPPASPRLPEKPVDRSIPTGPVGLDDLFGIANVAGRMSIGRAKKTTGTGGAD